MRVKKKGLTSIPEGCTGHSVVPAQTGALLSDQERRWPPGKAQTVGASGVQIALGMRGIRRDAAISGHDTVRQRFVVRKG